MLELMIVIAIIAIMATMAMPSYQDRTVRSQVQEGLTLAEFAKQAVTAYFAKTQTYPADNTAAGLPPADRIVGNYVSAIAVHGGSVDITFGNQASHLLLGKHLSVRPASVDGYPQVPLAWVCGHAKVPPNMTAAGQNTTDLAPLYLPLQCRAPTG